MSKDIRNLEPTIFWNHFCDLNAVPRASKKEDQVIQFIENFGTSLKLPVFKDAVGNVIIKKPATPGKENTPTLIIQGHLDMVHEKNAEIDFDFETQGIEMYIENGWVTANGTTLGADNGVAVAAMMNILSSTDIAHGNIECLFTIDEETGMTGAKELDTKNLSGKLLLNLDSEGEGEIYIGCAGGCDTTATKILASEEVDTASKEKLTIELKGLLGGHSGVDIHLGLINANKATARYLYHLSEKFIFTLLSFEGGSKRNVIPRESKIELLIYSKDANDIKQELELFKEMLREEYPNDPNIHFLFNQKPVLGNSISTISPTEQKSLINCLHACPNGVIAMSKTMPDLVETSTNLAVVEFVNSKLTIKTLQRSSIVSKSEMIAGQIKGLFELIGADVWHSSEYPGWTPNPNSEFVQFGRTVLEKELGYKPALKAIHAGLECGILQQHLPETDIMSFGPNIRGAHSPDERVEIKSIETFWKGVQAVIRAL